MQLKKLYGILLIIIWSMGFPGAVSAQEVENPKEVFLNNIWYLTKLTIEGEEFPFVPNEDLSEITLSAGFISETLGLSTTACDSGSGTIWFTDDYTFKLDGLAFLSSDGWTCEWNENDAYNNLYFYSYWNTENDPLYPVFELAITETETKKQLVLTKGNGNKAYYQDVPYMAVSDFVKNGPRIYPNPAKEYLYFDNLHQKTRLEIFDIAGRKRLARELNGTAAERVHIARFPAGIYFYRLQQNGAIVKTGKLVKR